MGGRKPVRMDALKKVFAEVGFRSARTVLASGNVIFEAPETNVDILARQVEEKLKETFGYEIGVIVRTAGHLRELVSSNPFEILRMAPTAKLYVTFLAEQPRSGLKIPYQSPTGAFCILKVTGSEVFSALDVSGGGRTVDSMTLIEKEFGKKVTTRNWNTINKLLA